VRSAPSFDQTPATPFASLLDDSTQNVPDSPPPPPPAADDRPSRADQPDRAAPPQAAKSDSKTDSKNDAKTDAKTDAKSADYKPADAADASPAVTGDGVKPGKTGKSTSNSNAVVDGKAADDANLGDQAATAGDAKAAADVKPADGQAPAVVIAAAAVAVMAPVPVLPMADAPVLAPDTSADAETAVAAATPTAVLAAASATLVATPKEKTAAPAPSPANGAKAAATAKLAPHTASQLQTDGKPQATAADADKTDAVTQARGEPAETKSDHRTAAVDAPGTATTDTNSAPKTAADAMQSANLNAPSQNNPATATAAAAAPQLAPQAAAIPLSGVAIDIASKAAAGTNHFEIRLDPPELGKIEVRLDVDKDGNVTTRMIADRSDTLDLLRRDSAGLERTLQDAGLKTADNSLQFSLRDHSAQQQQQDNSGARNTRLVVEDNTLPLIDAAQRGYSRLAGQGSGIDIHV
jgi:chemotaxis protein MotD